MKISVFDTYVKAKDGHTMHFDVYAKETEKIENALKFAKEWLKSIGEEKATVTQRECRFCHTQATTKEIENEIEKKGYYIYKMSGCP